MLRTGITDHKDKWGYGFSYDYDNSYMVKPLKITDRANFLVVFTLAPYQMLGKPLIMTAKTSTHALDIQCFVHSKEGHHSVIL